jgi:hypothetical protein
MAGTPFLDSRGQRLGRLVGTCPVGQLFWLFLPVGTIATLDLRVLGIAGGRKTIGQLATQLPPLMMWTGLALVALSGFVIFAGQATMFFPNAVFRAKLLLIVTSPLRAVARRAVLLERPLI